MNNLPNPWIDPALVDHRFVLDVDAFVAAIEQPPLFLSDPSPEYLRAAQIMPVLEVLAAY
jgi:hypothetical protein